MKKIFSLIIFICSSALVWAQPAVHSFSFTPKVGATLNELTGERVIIACASTQRGETYNPLYARPTYLGLSSATENSERKAGWMAGLDCQYQVSTVFGFVLGVNYAHLNSGIKALDSEQMEPRLSKLSVSYHYIQVPFLAKVYLYKGFAVHAGLQFDFSTKGESHIDGTFLDVPIHSNFSKVNTSGGEYYLAVSLPDDPKKVVFSVPVGVSYEYKHVVASASYNVPITRSYDRRVNYEENKLYNSPFQFSIGYRFELK